MGTKAGGDENVLRLDRAGLSGLTDHELLSLVLGSEVRGWGLVDRADGLRAIASRSPAEIARQAGIALDRAQALAAAFELGRRANAMRVARGVPLVSSLDVYRQFRPVLRDAKREIFLAALLDVKNRLLREVRISEGSLSASLVHPREAFSAAISEPAHAIIYVHNHPSGDPAPSDEDAVLTRRLSQAGELLGIKVLDHVIVGDDDYFSFADAGRLK